MVAQTGKNLPEMWETWVLSLGWKDPMEKGKVTYSSILAWRIPMDRGALGTTVSGVTKSQIGLSNFHFHFSFMFKIFLSEYDSISSLLNPS